MSSNKKVELRPKNREQPSFPKVKPQEKQPLVRVKAFLIELKACVALFRELLVEVKDVLVVATIILFFVLGVYEALLKLLH
jgi:hypothetical protein